MEGLNVKTFLTLLERTDRSLLKFLTHFRISEKNGKLILTTENPELKCRMEDLLSEKLGDEFPKSVEVILEKDEISTEGESEGLNKRFSFENFVVGEGNRLAYEVAKEVAQNPGRIYNPLFIYGGVGLGKTHLLQAVGNYCNKKGLRVIYRSANDFSEEMVEAIKTGKVSDFRNKYRKVDVLLLDDVQFLSGKERTQIEFFNVFNFMYLNEKQIVLASDRHPKELKDVSDRLISRFEGGLVVEICLDEMTKLEIIKRKLQELKIEVQEKIIESLMEQTSNNVRDIEGTIRGIKLRGIEHLRRSKVRTNELEKIKVHTALHFGLDVELLLGNTRSKKVNRVRQIAMYLCRRLTDASLIDIARAFNRKDHSTVIHSIKKIEKERRKDRKLNYIISFLEKNISERI